MGSYHTVLAIDSAMNGCGAALYCADQPQASVARHSPMMRGQAEALVPLVQEVVKEAGKAFSDIDLICTTIGPGTFTGLRVGMSAARSFALALNVPLVGISTLDVLAARFLSDRADGQALQKGECFCVLIETKRNDYYTALYDHQGNSLSAPLALDTQAVSSLIEDLQKNQVFLIGDAVERFIEEQGVMPKNHHVIQGYIQPDAMMLAQKGLQQALKNPSILSTEIAPLYLRGADVSMPKAPSRTLAEQ